jgi:diguanylate cyclase (GGDEF)-like protein/PAS domain S-box-containing protein
MDDRGKVRQQPEQALEYGEEHYRTLFKAIADAVVVHEVREDGPPGCFLEVNSVACARLGYSRDELLQMTPVDIDAPDSGVDINSIGRRVLAGETVTFEQVHVAKDGRRIPVEIRSQKFDLGGKVCVLSLVRDITERKQAEQEITQQQAFLRQVIDLDRNFIFAKDREGRFVLVNQAVAEAYGTTVDALLSKTDADFNPNADEVQAFRKADLEVMDTLREAFIPEEKITDAAGNVRWLQTIKRPIISENGTSDMVLCVATDITERKRVEEALKESEYRLDLALEASRLAVWDYDFVTGEVRLSRHWWPILGYAPDQVPMRIEAWEKLTHPDDLVRLKSALAAHLKGITSILDAEYRMQAKSGEWRWIRTVGRVVERDTGGRALRGTGTHDDVTLRKEQEQRIERLTRIQQVLSGINSAIVRIRHRDELFKEACRIAAEHGGFGIAWVSKFDPATMDVTPVAWAGVDAIGYEQLKTTARADVPRGHGVVGRAIRQREPVACNDMAAEPDVGSEQRREALRRGYRSDIALPLFEEGAVVGTLTLYAKEPNFFTEDEIKLLAELAGDVSFALDFTAKEEKLSYLAFYDALTGTANRTLLNDRLAQTLVQAHRYGHIVAVVVLNLDHFKLVNDSLGHGAGDELLKRCVGRIRSCVRESDTVARLGGDEFVLVLPGQSQASATARVISRVAEAVSAAPEITETLQRVLKSISEPMIVSERELNLTCSMGVSLYPQDGEDVEILLRNAGAALSRAKQLGRKNYQFYTAELNARIAERLSLHSALRQALERDEFTLHYQPKISLKTGEISGCEGLLRWNRPGTGLVSPGEFIPVLEETGLIIDVGRRVMEKAVFTYRQWHAQHGQPPRIAVNVSQLQLAQKDFTAVVEKILEDNENGPVGLEFEITESLIMQDIEANIAKLKAIRQMGITVAIDDFGTGHSSLSLIHRLPVDTLKIDRAFVASMDASPDGLAIVTTIISLARSLGLKVVAEGVETEEQVKMLRLLNCEEIQGYAISRPLPEDQFEAWWKAYRPKGGVGKSRDPS